MPFEEIISTELPADTLLNLLLTKISSDFPKGSAEYEETSPDSLTVSVLNPIFLIPGSDVTDVDNPPTRTLSLLINSKPARLKAMTSLSFFHSNTTPS